MQLHGECQWKVRREIITGVDTSPLVDVNAANSIVNRLEKLLSYLGAYYPKEGWGQYLSGCSQATAADSAPRGTG